MAVVVEILREPSDTAVQDLNHILPQMSHEGRLMTYEYLQKLLAASGVLAVCRDEGRIIGCAYLAIEVIPTKIKGWIEDVVVDEDYRGQGLAKKMLQLLVAEARDAGCMHVNLTSRPGRGSAQHLYGALGFGLRSTTVWRANL
jgi:GNAT superfamily N-acetyltransferase